MNNKDDLNKKALLVSFFHRVKNRIIFLENKKNKLMLESVKKSDEEQLKNIRESLFK